MPKIVLSTLKGGAGKSTMAIILATELAQREEVNEVVLVDTDPNQALIEWSQAGPVPDKIRLLEERDEDEIIDTMNNADNDGTIVIVDLEGIGSLLNSYAMSEADLVIVVSKPKRVDTKCAVKTIRKIKSTEKVKKERIPFVVAFTQCPSFMTNERKVLRASLEEKTRVLKTELSEYSRYSLLHWHGGGLRDLPGSKGHELKSKQKAIREAETFSSEVFDNLVEALQERQAHSEAQYGT